MHLYRSLIVKLCFHEEQEIMHLPPPSPLQVNFLGSWHFSGPFPPLWEPVAKAPSCYDSSASYFAIKASIYFFP